MVNLPAADGTLIFWLFDDMVQATIFNEFAFADLCQNLDMSNA
jgi:hypothetical protein